MFKRIRVWASGAPGNLRRVLFDARFRSEFWTRRRYGRLHFQAATHTREDRYPELFRQARTELSSVAAPAILSFGCSTGEEVLTLSRYLPHARITGVEINHWCLDRCRARLRQPGLNFLHSLSPDFAAVTGFDAIFCLAVFQRTENGLYETNPREGFGFAQFAQAIALLDRKLNPGGLLFLDHCDFSFADTSTARGYTPLPFLMNPRSRERPLFGPDNMLKAETTRMLRVFRKARRADGPEATPPDATTPEASTPGASMPDATTPGASTP